MAQKNEEKPSTKKDLVEFQDRIIHQFKIISEDLMQKIELVAEGVINVNENLGRVEKRLTEKISNVENDLSAIIRVSYLDLSKCFVLSVAGHCVATADVICSLRAKQRFLPC